MTRTTKIGIIGSGIAGLTLAIKLAKSNPVAEIYIFEKFSAGPCNTQMAQGGIAAVWDRKNDNFAQHIEDTMIAGGYLNNRQVVEMVVKQAPARIKELQEWGVEFDKEGRGFHLAREGGHSHHRVIHHQDTTGAEVFKNLRKKAFQHENISFYGGKFVKELIIEENVCRGILYSDAGGSGRKIFTADFIILATGGGCGVFSQNTNSPSATGDGIAMAFRSGAVIEKMEFIQFHPTALYSPGHDSTLLISEAVRGFGAILRNYREEAFMDNCHPQGSLAPRDVVAGAMAHELTHSPIPHLWLDCRHLDMEGFRRHFPMISARCTESGIDLTKDMIPVFPAAHYMIGGIKTNMNGRTSIPRLYAIGECASTGLHGANRLASNSLLEGAVFAHNAAQDISRKTRFVSNMDISLQVDHQLKPVLSSSTIKFYRNKLQQIMTENAGICRNSKGLELALKFVIKINRKSEFLLKKFANTPELYEFHNLTNIAYLILVHSLSRKENIGAL